MKLTVNKQDLAEAVSTVSRAASAKAVNPILEGIKLTVKNGELTIAATDLEIYIQKTIKADVQKDGIAIVAGKLFGDYIGKINKADVAIELEKDSIKLSHGDNGASFQTLSVDEYPEIINVNKKPHFSIKAKELQDIISKVKISVSQDDSRPVLKGVLCEVEKEKITCVSLDGFRLTKVEKKITNHAEPMQIIVSGKALEEINKLVKDDKGEVDIIVDKRFLQVNIGKTTFAGRLIDGQYINYRQTIPTVTNQVMVDKAELKTAIDRASILIRQDGMKAVDFIAKDNEILLKTNNQVGNIAEKVKAVTTKLAEAKVNSKYMIEALGAIQEQNICLKFNEATTMCVIESTEPGDYLFLIMLMREK